MKKKNFILGIVALSMLWRYPLAERVLILFLIKEGFMLLAGLWLTRKGVHTGDTLFCGKVCTAFMYVIGVILLLFPELTNEKVNLLLLLELVIIAGTLLAYAELYFCAALRLRKGMRSEQIDLKEIQKERKQKHRPGKKIMKFAGVLYLFYLILGAVLPYTDQPEVSETTKASFRTEEYFGAEMPETDGGVSADTAVNRRDTKKEAGSSTAGVDRAQIITDNGEALDLRLQMISHAKERVILSTFDFRTDEAGLDLLAVLLDAADRGVQVEIFADGFNSWLRMEGNPYFYALSAHPNAKIIVYNKVNLLKPWTAMGRMHDKYVIVDEKAYLLGGRNSFGYFLGDYEGHKNYDWDMLVYNTVREEAGSDTQAEKSSLYQVLDYYEGITSLDCCTVFHDRRSLADKPSVRRARKQMEQRVQTLQENAPELFAQEYDYQGKTQETSKITLLSNPTEYTVKEPVVFYKLMQLAQTAEKEVRIHTPYIMCNQMMYESFSGLGSKATLMFNSAANNGNPFGAIDYLNHKQELIDTGVNILEYEGGISYHGKVLTVDDRLSAVGSFNMDMRSVYLDTELMLVIDSPQVNQDLREKMGAYEKEAALVETVDTYREIPEGMVMQEISFQKKCIRTVFGWLQERLRFLL